MVILPLALPLFTTTQGVLGTGNCKFSWLLCNLINCPKHCTALGYPILDTSFYVGFFRHTCATPSCFLKWWGMGTSGQRLYYPMYDVRTFYQSVNLLFILHIICIIEELNFFYRFNHNGVAGGPTPPIPERLADGRRPLEKNLHAMVGHTT